MVPEPSNQRVEYISDVNDRNGSSYVSESNRSIPGPQVVPKSARAASCPVKVLASCRAR